MLEWIGLNREAAWWTAVASAGMLVAGLIVVPWLVIRLPADYFDDPRRSIADWPYRHLWLRWVWVTAKNAVGLTLLVLGALMLILPGQGLLTLLIAAALLDFPGKFRLERWVITRKGVIDTANWMRRKAGRCPFVLDSRADAEPHRS